MQFNANYFLLMQFNPNYSFKIIVNSVYMLWCLLGDMCDDEGG